MPIPDLKDIILGIGYWNFIHDLEKWKITYLPEFEKIDYLYIYIYYLHGPKKGTIPYLNEPETGQITYLLELRLLIYIYCLHEPKKGMIPYLNEPETGQIT